MSIKSYNRLNANSIRQLNRVETINSTSNGGYVVSRVQPVDEVKAGFNATSLYLAKIYKDLREKKDDKARARVKDMSFNEFVYFFNDVQNDYVKNNFKITEELSREQILLMQDILLSINKNASIFENDKQVVILEDIDKMDNNEFRKFLFEHNEIFSNSGLFHSNDNVFEMTEEDIFNLKDLLLIKIRDIQDLFYYNKAFKKYEKSYNDMAYFESDGVNA